MEDIVTGLVGVGAFGLLVTKLLDLLRNAFDPSNHAPKFVWNVVAFALGIAIAIIWEINLVENLVENAGAVTNGVRSVAGQVITGLLFGGGSGAWHEYLDRKRSA